ncbi:MAG: hypothetical protein AUI05_00780 [Verrucomicrobia bacterium 13_2_20CM_2_54_15_9cls]|nr:MAG: hypothetical protein AUI05_00780 [Verrucomicrobia bacterium 13_2_20CM_2_54_15_9cls]
MTDAELVREIAQPLSGSRGNYDALLQLIGDARELFRWAKPRTEHTSFISAALRLRNGSSLRRAFRFWPLRRTGPTQPAFT